MIAIIDYGIGNLASIANMMRRAGAQAVVTDRPEVVTGATALILPGVGAFDACVNAFRRSPVREAVHTCVEVRRVPVLGICVGMQMMARRSEEGVENGLGWFDADVKRLTPDPASNLKVPHLGWRHVEADNRCPLFADAAIDRRFYFAHSYHVVCDRPGDVVASYDYGGPVACSIWAENRFGVQFHPEKSHSHGIRLFSAFMQAVGERSLHPAYDAI